MIYIFIILGLVSIMGVYFLSRLIRLKNFMDEAVSGVDAQLKRRHELISGTVEAVKGYQGREPGVLQEVAQLLPQLMCPVPMKDRGRLENDLSRALKSIFAMAENTSGLPTDKNFLILQNNLVEIEDQIQTARRHYNGVVRDYNAQARSFPTSLIAGVLNFKRGEFFEIEYATQRKIPKGS